MLVWFGSSVLLNAVVCWLLGDRCTVWLEGEGDLMARLCLTYEIVFACTNDKNRPNLLSLMLSFH